MRLLSDITSTIISSAKDARDKDQQRINAAKQDVLFDQVDPILIARVRETFFNDAYEQDKDQYDATDIDQLKTNDWMIKRFLIATSNHEHEAYERLVCALKWRKEMNLRSLNDSDFMQELYNTGSLFLYEKDKDGLPTLIMRLKFLKRINEFLDNMKLFCMYNIFKIDEHVNGGGTYSI